MAPTELNDVMSFEAPSTEVPVQLRAKGPVYTGIQDCLRIQSHAVPRTRMHKLFGRCPLDDEARPRYAAVLAEAAIGQLLPSLSAEWTVLQAEPAPFGQNVVDHMLIGPSGLYSITTIGHENRRVVVSGESLSTGRTTAAVLGDSRREAARIAQQLSVRVKAAVEVTPLVVVVAPVSIATRSTPGVVAVMPSTGVLEWLHMQPRVHTAGALALYERVVLDQGEWKPVARATDDTIRHLNRFDRLHTEVNTAGARARAWSRLCIAGIGAGVVGAVAVVGILLINAAG